MFTIETLTLFDQPDSRGRQLLAALDHLTRVSPLRGRVDSSRLGVMGHSMGGGGSLEAAKSRPSLQAAVPLTPWNLDKTWPELRTPTLITGCRGDSIAPVRSHSEPFYESLPSSLDRAYLELNGATHFAPNSPDTTIAKYSIAWLKRFIDNDTRYEQFLCPLPRRASPSRSTGATARTPPDPHTFLTRAARHGPPQAAAPVRGRRPCARAAAALLGGVQDARWCAGPAPSAPPSAQVTAATPRRGQVGAGDGGTLPGRAEGGYRPEDDRTPDP